MRVAIALYRLATSAEDRTMVNLFDVSCSSVNNIFREFCGVVMRCIEAHFVRFPQTRESKEHLRRFGALTGFPQCRGALDGCHIEVCSPEEPATDYYIYNGPAGFASRVFDSLRSVAVWASWFTVPVGHPPFQTHTLKKTYGRINKSNYRVTFTLSSCARKLIRKLLKPDSKRRPNAEAILEDEFMLCGEFLRINLVDAILVK
ncbi:hypothetical protein HPB51_002979 [Rhipicephalus microplus]|uniref:DDE Tnp4 domain-containing protein n=1 Tax=Rhipicephalus microplus TaxID=6941 RepID=A0A9J6EEM2_RHIMP|nr:hypothetical protein HPB51_002979 [Rhipicephalus microplus]